LSLIADALKAAQEQRGGNASRVAAARTVLGGPPGERRRAAPARLVERGGWQAPRKLQLALVAFGLTVAGAAGFLALAPAPLVESGAPELAAVTSPMLAAGGVQTVVRPLAAQETLESPGGEREALVAGWAWEMEDDGLEPLAPPSLPVSAAEIAGEAPLPRARGVEREPAPHPGPEPRFQLTVEPRPTSAAGSAVELARTAFDRRDYRTAITGLRAALLESGEDPELLNRLGSAHQALGELPEARDAYRRAVAARPGFSAAWSNLGVVLQAQGQAREAQLAFAEAVRLDRGNEGARVNLAILHQGQGLTSEARSLLEEVLRGNARHAEAHYALGRLLEQEGDRLGAVRHYQLFLTHGVGRFPQLEPQVLERVRLLSGSGR
jgi:tetratricopeptide (TPR) repeat protein